MDGFPKPTFGIIILSVIRSYMSNNNATPIISLTSVGGNIPFGTPLATASIHGQHGLLTLADVVQYNKYSANPILNRMDQARSKGMLRERLRQRLHAKRAKNDH